MKGIHAHTRLAESRSCALNRSRICGRGSHTAFAGHHESRPVPRWRRRRYGRDGFLRSYDAGFDVVVRAKTQHLGLLHSARIQNLPACAGCDCNSSAIFHAPVAGTALQPFHYADPGWRDLAVQATLIPNMLAGKGPIMGVLWSLPYEVEMYILLPVLFFFLRKNFAIWPLLLMWIMVVLLTLGVPKAGHNFGLRLDTSSQAQWLTSDLEDGDHFCRRGRYPCC